ncbi:unnamed protein product, partial [Urochloa humidicola]
GISAASPSPLDAICAAKNQTIVFPWVPQRETRHGHHISRRACPRPQRTPAPAIPGFPPSRTTTTPLESIGSTDYTSKSVMYAEFSCSKLPNFLLQTAEIATIISTLIMGQQAL